MIFSSNKEEYKEVAISPTSTQKRPTDHLLKCLSDLERTLQSDIMNAKLLGSVILFRNVQELIAKFSRMSPSTYMDHNCYVETKAYCYYKYSKKGYYIYSKSL